MTKYELEFAPAKVSEARPQCLAQAFQGCLELAGVDRSPPDQAQHVVNTLLQTPARAIGVLRRVGELPLEASQILDLLVGGTAARQPGRDLGRALPVPIPRLRTGGLRWSSPRGWANR